VNETTGTFSESWYRIADQHAALRPHVQVRRQFFRGERWYVLQDPINNQFFRLRPTAYDFIARLRLDRSIEQAWRACATAHPEDAPGQEDVIRLLSQLYAANLLHSDLPPDSARLFERYKLRRQREIQSTLMNVMFARIPLFDPDSLLQRLRPLIRILYSPFGALIWLVTVGAAIKVGLDNSTGLKDQSQGILDPGNIFLLYVGIVITKAVHELGHAFACRRFGGEVHTLGVMFMIFTPVPYVDATSAWSFRNRSERILVGAAGMIQELFLAAIAMFIWANTGEGTLHHLAFNMIFLSSATTLLFNLNPLMRFDGYYILSDLLDIPNLYSQATRQLIYLVERFGFGCKKAESEARTRREAVWLTVFGLTGHVYRVIVFSGILLFVADRFLILGIIMAVVCLVSWVIVPTVRLVRYLAASPKLERNRVRAVSVVACTAAALVVLLGIVPFPNSFRAPGILEAVEHSIIANETPGYLDAILTPTGTEVMKGQQLARFHDQDLEFSLASTRAQLEETRAMELRALQRETADLKPLRARLVAITKHLALLEEQHEALTVRARQDGTWIAPDLDKALGSWLARGSPLGVVMKGDAYRFSATVSEREASRLFDHETHTAQVRLRGQAGIALAVSSQVIIPAERDVLPSAALGWRGGGELPVSPQDNSGLRATEPFFEVRAGIVPRPGAALVHGRSGKIRFQLAPEPLLRQWVRKLRQLLQNRYSL
jgi:putative peptide zinc metalloprotease protein